MPSNLGGAVSSFHGSPSRVTSVCLGAAFLTKLAKHLALLACLMIVGQAGGRLAIGQRAVFLLIILAALIHAAGGALQRRLRARLTFSRGSR